MVRLPDEKLFPFSTRFLYVCMYVCMCMYVVLLVFYTDDVQLLYQIDFLI
jgi:hypothetical protein